MKQSYMRYSLHFQSVLSIIIFRREMRTKEFVSMATMLAVLSIILQIRSSLANTEVRNLPDIAKFDSVDNTILSQDSNIDIGRFDVDSAIDNVIEELKDITGEISRQRSDNGNEQNNKADTSESSAFGQNISQNGDPKVDDVLGFMTNVTLYNFLMSRVLSNPSAVDDIFSGYENERQSSNIASKSSHESTIDTGSDTIKDGNDDMKNGSEFNDYQDHNVIKRNRMIELRPSCSMDALEMTMHFSEYTVVDERSVFLVCEGRIRVNKCEGLCNSSVSPDVNSYVGFSEVRASLCI